MVSVCEKVVASDVTDLALSAAVSQIVNNFIGLHMCTLGLCCKLGGGIGCFLKRTLLGPVPLFLAMEAVSFLDTFVFLFGGKLVDTNGIDIHHIQVAFVAAHLISLHESFPVLLSLQI